MVHRLSNIATHGTLPNNAERDLQVLLAKTMGLHMELEDVDVRMWDHKDSKIVQTKIPVLMPDQLATAIWRMWEDVFERFFLGDMSCSDVEHYWNHVYSTSEWFRVHPSVDRPRSGLIPLTLYGDEVATYKGTEVGSIMVLAWTSDFLFNRSPILRYFLLTAYSEYVASDHTHRDIMTAVCRRITSMVDGSKQFPWSSRFTFMFSSNQGDLKYMLYKHNLFPYNNNDFCSLCKCSKTTQEIGMSLGDFRESAAHIGTLVSHEEYIRATTPEERHPVYLTRCI